MKIDAHSHFIPDTLLEMIRKDGAFCNTEIIDVDGKPFIRHFEGFQYPMFEGFYKPEVKLADMAKMGLDHTVLSVSPGTFYYWIDAGAALETSKICNDWVSDLSKKDPAHFSGMATIPMQDIPAALKELERAHEKLGLNALEIAPVINEKNLDEKEFFPIYEYCAANGILIALHPYYIGVKPQFARYYNTNLIANVLETNMGINSLIFGGAFEQFPALRVLAAHGGGYFPYQLGRLVHGYEVRNEAKVNIPKAPDQYLDNLYYDTITHWLPPLQFLADTFGADHVVIGTDYPYDMGDYQPVEHVKALRLTDAERELIFGGNVEKLLH
ncbi:MAG: amidohydrolase [Oscillibacter sp.]|nr:amidohydrolase [Oscillibacter sp.]